MMDTTMKAFFFMPLMLLSGCIMDSDLSRADYTDLAQEMTRQRAAIDLKCREAVADRPIRSDRMDDWEDGLYSEYFAWADGCGRQVRYLLVCRTGSACEFADRPNRSPRGD
jgi:hypothetical protein